MRKIADTAELQTELRRLIAYSEGDQPSREKLIEEIHDLSARVAGTVRTAYATPQEDIAKAIALLDFLPNLTAKWADAHNGNQVLARKNGERIKDIVHDLGEVLSSMPNPVVYFVYGVEAQPLSFKTADDLIAGLARLGFDHTGYTPTGSSLRPELQGQPKFSGLNGPMHDGGGKVRYEGKGVGDFD